MATIKGLEYKRLPAFVESIDEAARTVTGVFAVHGNIDALGDMSQPGAFDAAINGKGRDRTRFLWNHDGYSPPIASILEIRELGRDELPEAVLEWAPEATGGMQVVRKYYDGIPMADWVFRGIVEGDITEMSYAYKAIRYEQVQDPERPKLRRILQEVELYDISDVNWGMNPATSGVKSILGPGMTFREHSSMVVTAVREFLARVEERKSFREQDNRNLSAAVRDELAEMSAQIEAILRATQPKADDAAVRSQVARFLYLSTLSTGLSTDNTD